MADLEAWEGHYPETLFSHGYRRAQEGYPTTLAMHWDGTYRDRVRGSKIVPEYWKGDDYSEYLRPASTFAKHLA